MEISEVVKLAGEAGFGANQRNTLLTKLRLFAEKVALNRSEACAQVCDSLDDGRKGNLATRCADAIRERYNAVLRGEPLAASPSRKRGSASSGPEKGD